MSSVPLPYPLLLFYARGLLHCRLVLPALGLALALHSFLSLRRRGLCRCGLGYCGLGRRDPCCHRNLVSPPHCIHRVRRLYLAHLYRVFLCHCCDSESRDHVHALYFYP